MAWSINLTGPLLRLNKGIRGSASQADYRRSPCTNDVGEMGGAEQKR